MFFYKTIGLIGLASSVVLAPMCLFGLLMSYDKAVPDDFWIQSKVAFIRFGLLAVPCSLCLFSIRLLSA